MPDSIIEFIRKRNNSILVQGVVTLLFPKYFLKKCFQNNTYKDNNWHGKKAGLTISFDCDYPKDVEAMPELLSILNKYQFKTSFACVGHWIEKYPNEHKAILDAGHEIVNHTYSHPDNEILNPGRKFKTILRQEKKEEIERCHAICKKILSYEPIGCRIPHFKNLFTDEIYGILKDLGYKYSSSTLLTNTESYGLPFKTSEGIYEFPLSTCPKHPFTVFDTWHSFKSPRWYYKIGHRTGKEYVNLFKFLVDIGIETNSYINIYIDPYDVVKMKKFRQVLDYINDRDNKLLVANYRDIINTVKS